MPPTRRPVLAGLLLFLLCTGLAAADSTPKSIYERIGGEAAIRGVVDDFVPAAAADPKVNFTRDGRWQASDAAVSHLKSMLVEFLSSALGGPQKYSGRDMKSTHQGLRITQGEFDALAGHLKATLEKHKVPSAEVNAILKIAASTANDIVEIR